MASLPTPGTEAGKQQPTESFKDTLGQSGKLCIGVINWEAARAKGGSGTLQSAIGWLDSHKNIMLIIQPEMKDRERLGVARALTQAADNTRIIVPGSRSQAIFSEPFLREEEITSVFCWLLCEDMTYVLWFKKEGGRRII